MVKLSVEISDAVAPDFAGKLQAAQALGIHNLEMGDCIEGKRFDTLTGAEMECLRDALIDANVRLVLLSTQIPADDHEALKQLFRRALQLDVEAICIQVRDGDDTDFVRRLAESYSIDLCVENRADGAFPDEQKLFEAVQNRGVKVIFNPLEIVKTERHPFFHAYYGSHIKNDIRFLRICDGLYRVHEPVPLGQGCAEVKELSSIMLCRSFKGYFSFIPYMPAMDLEAYRTCIDTFKNMLKHS